MNTESYQPMSGRMLDADGSVHNLVSLLGGGTPVSYRKYDIEKYSPRNGNVIDKNGNVTNIVSLLGGDTPVSDRVYSIEQFAPWYGGVIGEDGLVYDIVELFSGYSGGTGLSLKVINGELYATYNGTEGAARFELDAETGILYCVVEEG